MQSTVGRSIIALCLLLQLDMYHSWTMKPIHSSSYQRIMTGTVSNPGCSSEASVLSMSMIRNHRSNNIETSPDDFNRQRHQFRKKHDQIQVDNHHATRIPSIATLSSLSKDISLNIRNIMTSFALLVGVLSTPLSIEVDKNANIELFPSMLSSTALSSTLSTGSSNNYHRIVSGIHIKPHQAYAASFLTENQRQVKDVWWAVSCQYYDTTYNGLGEDGWKLKRDEAMEAVEDTGPDDQEDVTKAIQSMLSSLNDPYTRFLPSDKYETLTTYARGSNANGASGGIGVTLLQDLRLDRTVVMNIVPNSPAAKGGIRAGDIILEVNGESVVEKGTTAEIVAAKCRGAVGEVVTLKIQHADALGMEDNNNAKSSKIGTEKISLTRTITTKVNPVESSIIELDNDNKKNEGQQRIGYLKVSAFNQETKSQVIDGLQEFRNSDVGQDQQQSSSSSSLTAIVLDLRGNVGGYMPAGIDVAKLFLPSNRRIIIEVDRYGKEQTINSDGIGSETSVPLYVLVDQRTASASEIVTAALQDNSRAIVIGATKTFGKGRIQNIQPLDNNTGVAVTRAKYITPSGRDIHGIGITPDQLSTTCKSNDSLSSCLSGVI